MCIRDSDIAFGQTRIAVHSGEVVVGNFGGSVIFDYRALGDPVNTTSRLESLNGQIGTLVCVSAAIREHCPEVPMRRVGEVQLKGKAEAVAVFEPLEAMAVPATDRDEAYEMAYQLLASDAAEALGTFETLSQQRPWDGLVAYHLQRLRNGERGNRLVMASK